jgi:ribose transport system substrate-binding protein
MRRSVFALTILLLGALVLAGCGGTSAVTPTAAPTSTTAAAAPTAAPPANLTFGLALSTLNNPFFVEVQNGAQAEAQASGVTLIVADGQNDPTTQASQIEDFITRKVDAILLNPTDSNAVVPSVQKANEANIPVLTLDRSAASGNIVTLIASDNVLGGQMAADFLCQQIGGTGNVVELQGIAGTSAARDRGQGFDEEMASKCPGATIVAKQPANFDRADGNSVFANILTAQPDIAGVFAQNDEMCLGAIQAAQAAGRTGIIFVGFDGIPDGLYAVAAGQETGDIAQQPTEMGKLAVQKAIAYLQGQSVPSFIPVPLQLVTKDNVVQFMEASGVPTPTPAP